MVMIYLQINLKLKLLFIPSACTVIGGAGTAVIPTCAKKAELTKLYELPLSTRLSMVLFYTLALILMASLASVPAIACNDN
jgi:hypothetical protein